MRVYWLSFRVTCLDTRVKYIRGDLRREGTTPPATFRASRRKLAARRTTRLPLSSFNAARERNVLADKFRVPAETRKNSSCFSLFSRECVVATLNDVNLSKHGGIL